MSPDSGCPFIGVAPVCSPNPDQPVPNRGRRSSLKTSRELLTFSSSSALGPFASNSAKTLDTRRRRSVMFSLPNTLNENPVDGFKNENRTDTSSTSSNSLSSRVLSDVDELDASQKESDEFEANNQVHDDNPSIFTFEEAYVRCVLPNQQT